jgi:hypothetical protein
MHLPLVATELERKLAKTRKFAKSTTTALKSLDGISITHYVPEIISG